MIWTRQTRNDDGICEGGMTSTNKKQKRNRAYLKRLGISEKIDYMIRLFQQNYTSPRTY